MGSFLFENMDFQEFSTRLLVPLFVTLLFFQGFRTFVVNMYVAVWNIIWYDSSIIPMLAMVAFFTPIIGVIIGRKISDRKLMIWSAILTSIFSLPIALGGQLELILGASGFGLGSAVELFLSALVIACYSIFLPSYVASQITGESGTSKEGEVALFIGGFTLAFGYDILIRSFYGMYDVSRVFLYLLPQTILVVIILVLLVKEIRVGESKRPRILGVSGVSASRLGGVLLPLGIGMALFLELSLLANPQNVLRWAQPAYTLLELAVLVILTILVFTLTVLALFYSPLASKLPLDRWYFFLIGNAIIIAALTCLLFVGTWLSVALVLVAQFFIVLDIYILVQYLVQRQFRWGRFTVLSLSFFLSLIFLLLLCFMTGFAFAYAYLGSLGAIFEGQAPTLILAATVILLLTSTAAAYKVGGVEP